MDIRSAEFSVQRDRVDLGYVEVTALTSKTTSRGSAARTRGEEEGVNLAKEPTWGAQRRGLEKAMHRGQENDFSACRGHRSVCPRAPTAGTAPRPQTHARLCLEDSLPQAARRPRLDHGGCSRETLCSWPFPGALWVARILLPLPRWVQPH